LKRYQGIYAPLIEQYIAFKQNLGYKFVDAEFTYGMFDRFTIDQGLTTIGITRELADKWGIKRPNESDSTRYRRVMYLIQLASFLNEAGYPSYIPKLPGAYKSTFTPYIFSQKELQSIFKACDTLKSKGNMNSSHNVIPALFRVLYGTGIRIGEAVALKNKNVHLQERYFIIRDSKNAQERMVPLSESLSQVCEQYRKSLRESCEPEQYFFVKRNGQKCTGSTIYEWFRKVLRIAGISHGGKGYGPRLHDFRHAFSVYSLVKMAKSGLDLYYSLPILSAYLGHQSLEATDRYVRLTSDLFPDLIQDVNAICAYVFPEVNHHAAD